MKYLLCFLLLGYLTTYSQNENILLKTDFNAEITYGNVDDLIEAINRGASIRVGWSLDFDGDEKGDLTHWIDAEFLSIYKGQVFNQILPINRQYPQKDVAEIVLKNNSIEWTGMIGTNGVLQSRYIFNDNLLETTDDELLLEQLKKRSDVKQRIVATTWVVK